MSWYDNVKPVDRPAQLGNQHHAPPQFSRALRNPADDPEIMCHNCPARWRMSTTEPATQYKCRECGYDNTPHYRPQEPGKGEQLDVTAQKKPEKPTKPKKPEKPEKPEAPAKPKKPEKPKKFATLVQSMNFNSRDISRLVKHPQGQMALHMHDYGKARRLVDEWNERDRKDEFNRLTQRLSIPLPLRQNPFAPQAVQHILPILQTAARQPGDPGRLAQMALRVYRDAGIAVPRL